MTKNLSDTSILMISFDTGLLAEASSGDVVSRHQRYAQGLKRLDIIVFGRSKVSSRQLAENCQVYGVGRDVWSFFKAGRIADKLFAQNHYDLVDAQDPHLAGYLAWRLAKKHGVKFEVHFHGDFWQNSFWLKESVKNRFYDYLQNKIVFKADAIRVVSRLIKDKLLKSGLKENKIAIINTPVNESQFSGSHEAVEAELIKNDYPGKKILLFVGRLVAAKNLFFLLEVVQELSKLRHDFVVLLIGAGEEESKLRQEIDSNSLDKTVHLLGAKKQEEILNYYQAAYLFLLLSNNESFGKVIIEAGFAGLPTLASRTLGPMSIIIDKHNGWLVDINDLPATLNQLNYLLDKKEVVLAAGHKAREDFLRDYSQMATYKKVEDFWYKIVNGQL